MIQTIEGQLVLRDNKPARIIKMIAMFWPDVDLDPNPFETVVKATITFDDGQKEPGQ